MKVLSLSQPWASLCVERFDGAKQPPKGWETRGWKPSKENMSVMYADGFLIHATAKPAPLHIRCTWPMMKYIFTDRVLPQGCIIGHATLGRVMTTHDWVRRILNPVRTPDDERMRDEFALGDYSAGRWAWELLNVIHFKTPIPAKGKLSLWEYNEPINLMEQ